SFVLGHHYFFTFRFQVNLLQVRDAYIYANTITKGAFLFHYTVIPIILGILYFLRKKKGSVLPDSGFLNQLFSWFVTVLLVFIASAELDNIFIIITNAGKNNYMQMLEISHKVGYPILWAMFAFILISIGIKISLKL
ncbi:MAG: hypothetical protein HC830_08495, partial [Bacteroidetes bacterium]|nr:hypothetical protein [Bacteroidota bacterium]